jgi:hypothetical protein
MLWFWSEEETWLSDRRLVNIQLFWSGNHTWKTKMSAPTISTHGVMEGGGSYNLHARVPRVEAIWHCLIEFFP